jgi:endonuclease/exonuclease/phosphatase family metal-dependent hydrolase
MRKLFLFTVLFSLALQAQGQVRQGSIRLMTYNILNYRNGTTYCTGNNNSSSAKESGIATIVNYVEPDIIVFNEVSSSANNPTYLLNNALNTNGTTSWAMANYTHNGFSSLVNAIAYNSTRFTVANQWTIDKDANNNSLTRLIDVVNFHMIDSMATPASWWDTTSFYVIAAHFKAGNTTADASEREKEAQAIMDWIDNNLNTNVDHNIFLLGDLNTYGSSEASYAVLTAGSGYRLEDPINTSGNWHNNSTYANVHTQSTSTATSGCKSGGGLDDRFDHILISEAVGEGNLHLTYAPNSYIAVGNDGNHFNNAVNSGTNYSATTAVISALATVSDHLPVILDVDLYWAFDLEEPANLQLNLPNPARTGQRIELPAQTSAELIDLTGQVVGHFTGPFSVPSLAPGMYLLRIERNSHRWTQKLLVR